MDEYKGRTAIWLEYKGYSSEDIATMMKLDKHRIECLLKKTSRQTKEQIINGFTRLRNDVITVSSGGSIQEARILYRVAKKNKLRYE